MSRARWLALLLGALLGFAAGLYYSWVVNPVEYVDTAPISLREDYKGEMLSLIASAYAATGDIERARVRLSLLGISNLPGTLSRMAQSLLATGASEREARALAELAAALGERPDQPVQPGATQAATLTPPAEKLATSTATPEPIHSPTPRPTATPGAPFKLIRQEDACDSPGSTPQIQLLVLDASGNGAPGIQARVVWDGGQDRFYTGLKPELGQGYADFDLQPGVIYTLELAGGAAAVTDLQAAQCPAEEGGTLPGSITLVFQQPSTP